MTSHFSRKVGIGGRISFGHGVDWHFDARSKAARFFCPGDNCKTSSRHIPRRRRPAGIGYNYKERAFADAIDAFANQHPSGADGTMRNGRTSRASTRRGFTIVSLLWRFDLSRHDVRPARGTGCFMPKLQAAAL